MNNEYRATGTYAGRLSNYQESGRDVYKFYINNDSMNRNGWRTISTGIQYQDYMRNPVVLYNHNKDLAIGSCVQIEVTESNEVIAYIWFDELTEISKTVKNQVDIGVLRATSIWVNPIQIDYIQHRDEDGWLITDEEILTTTELLEISIVTVPANKDTLRTAQKKHSKETNILEERKSMKPEEKLETAEKQTNLIEDNTQLSTIKELREELNKEKQLTEKLKTDYTELDKKTTETIEKLTGSLLDLQERTQEIEVERDLASIPEKFLAGIDKEKVKNDLLFYLKSNYRDSDGNKLYNIELEKIKTQSNSLSYLTKPLINNEQATDSVLPPYNVSDFLNEATAEKYTRILDNIAKEKNLTYIEVFEKYRNGAL